jgi:hypothetical protein
LFFEGKTQYLELIEMNEHMVFSESRLLVKLPQFDCSFYGIHDGSLVLRDGCILGGEVTFYRIALTKPERLRVLAGLKHKKRRKVDILFAETGIRSSSISDFISRC